MGQHELALTYHEQFLTLNDSSQRCDQSATEQMEFARQVLLDSMGKEEEKQEIKLSTSRPESKTESLNAAPIAGIIFLLLALALTNPDAVFSKKIGTASKPGTTTGKTTVDQRNRPPQNAGKPAFPVQ
ncbi:MAG: hypothetical protein IPL27_20670 [Lewinellaceae bacterium]|nr:hypothetical protein [Lewinellaceae bacterium]